MKHISLALLLVLCATSASAQIGGNGVSKNTTAVTLGYNQTVVYHGLAEPWYCAGMPVSQNAQPKAAMVLYTATGQPLYFPGC